MTYLDELIRQQIALQGPMPFDEFVALALYHPKAGYYNQPKAPRGRRGDYMTSNQVGGLIPKLLGPLVLELKQSMGSDPFSVIEFGAGDGEFLEGLYAWMKDQNAVGGFQLIAVEASASARERLKKRLSRCAKCYVVSSLDEFEGSVGLEGLVFSNEFFDALPFKRLVRRGSAWNEIAVGLEGSLLVEQEVPAATALVLPALSAEPDSFEEGQEVEIRLGIQDWYERLSRLFFRGAIVTIDYGGSAGSLYHPGRMKGTWRCFEKHTLSTAPFERIGQKDITANANFSQLARAGERVGFKPVLFASQGVFLAHAGAKSVQVMLDSCHTNEDRARLKGGLQQLLHPDLMGEAFQVLLQLCQVPAPDLLQSLPNRIHRL